MCGINDHTWLIPLALNIPLAHSDMVFEPYEKFIEMVVVLSSINYKFNWNFSCSVNKLVSTLNSLRDHHSILIIAILELWIYVDHKHSIETGPDGKK